MIKRLTEYEDLKPAVISAAIARQKAIKIRKQHTDEENELLTSFI